MTSRQRVSKQRLRELLVEHGILDGINGGKYHPIEQSNVPAGKVPEGRSLIISYYDKGHYLCTIHRLTTKDGRVVHEHAEDVVIDGVRYDKERQGKSKE